MRILYVTTTFPVYSETFLQREVRALKALGAELAILSLHKGEERFDDIEIDRFSKWELLKVIWLLPVLIGARFELFRRYMAAFFGNRPASWLNFWENLLGFGVSIVRYKQIQLLNPDIIHCTWSSAPAAFGWLTHCRLGIPFSVGAHAYDLFENGGDWLLSPKLEDASLIHTSTESAASELRDRGFDEKVHLIRRGLNHLPKFKPLRLNRKVLRIICVARLVEKKGFPFQLAIYEALMHAGIDFEARIVGEGELRSYLLSEIERRGLGEFVSLIGKLSFEETLSHIAWADALFHTGVIARDGDRDGLPNVIPEAMASGVIVVGSPVSGVVEAIEEGETGFLREVDDPNSWVSACQRIQSDDSICVSIRLNGRQWMEREFNAQVNSGKLLELMYRCVETTN